MNGPKLGQFFQCRLRRRKSGKSHRDCSPFVTLLEDAYVHCTLTQCSVFSGAVNKCAAATGESKVIKKGVARQTGRGSRGGPRGSKWGSVGSRGLTVLSACPVLFKCCSRVPVLFCCYCSTLQQCAALNVTMLYSLFCLLCSSEFIVSIESDYMM